MSKDEAQSSRRRIAVRECPIISQHVQVRAGESPRRAMESWELSKYPTQQLVDELIARDDLTGEQGGMLLYHAMTLESMYNSDPNVEDIKRQIEEI